MKRIVITGGHHSSALPVIKELKKRHPKLQIFWFGHKKALARNKNNSLEYQEITALKIPFYDLKAGKFYRSFNPIKILKIPYGFLQSIYLLLKIKPEVVLSFGGYLAVPVVLAGKILGIKTVTHEQTVVLGYANKFISKFVDRVVYTWPQSDKYFPVEKSVMVGLPLREEIFHAQSYKFPIENNLPTVYLTAGKTGSHLLNMAVFENMESILKKFNLIHQTGDYSKYNDYEKLKEKYHTLEESSAEELPGKYFPEKFIYAENIGEAFSKANFIISRSGAHTCYEVLALEKPAVFIPLPHVSHNEQYKNALKVKDLGLAEILPQSKLSGEELLKFISNFSDNLSLYRLHKKDVLVKNSAQKIVDELEEVLQS